MPFTQTVTVPLDDQGNGTLQIGPNSISEVWWPTSVTISSTGQPASVATASVFAGAQAAPWTFIDQAFNVVAAASSVIRGRYLSAGQFVFVEFVNAAPTADYSSIILDQAGQPILDQAGGTVLDQSAVPAYATAVIRGIRTVP
jgi:hypothetical protein